MLNQIAHLQVPLDQADADIARLIEDEKDRQYSGVELIASENYISVAVMEAMGTVLNNRYSEGYPGNRYYGGQEVMDQIENLAIDRACQLFGAGHANVQPHAGAPANLATYFALAKPGETILGMDLSHGGHLTHGSPVTHASNVFHFERYKMKDVETGSIDYDEVRRTAKATRPRIILVGHSSYPRQFDYAAFRSIADETGSYLIADVAHFAGLIAGGAMENPFDHNFDVLLSTTHKTLRGPRGGLILAKNREIGSLIDKSVFPGMQGGPIMQMVAAKAVAFKEAQQPAFATYARKVLENAKAMAEELMRQGLRLITNGTDNHLMLVDCVTSWSKTGREVQELLDTVGITLNKNVIPDDRNGPRNPSGVRLGTPAMTTRGMGTGEMETVARCIAKAAATGDEKKLKAIREEIRELAYAFPVPGIPAI